MERRPNLSTVQKESGVEQTLTRVKMSEIKKVLLIALGGLKERSRIVEDEVDTSPGAGRLASGFSGERHRR